MLKKTRVVGLTLAILFGLTYSLNLSAQTEEPKPDQEELFAGDTKAVATYASNGMLINPTRPISIDSTNPRYFNYYFSPTVNQTVALVGISGDYLPHVQLTHTGLHQGTPSEAVSRAYCGYNKLVTQISTAEVLFQLEDYGWCKKGEGGEFVAAGNIGRGGTIPVNTGGGLLSNWHLGDLTGWAEAVTQLRGEGGDRQVDDCKVALSTGHGGELVSPGMCSIHTSTILAVD